MKPHYKKFACVCFVIVMILVIPFVYSDSSVTDGGSSSTGINQNADQKTVGTEKQNIGKDVGSNLKPEDVQVKSNIDEKSVDMQKTGDTTKLTGEGDFTLAVKKSEAQEQFSTNDKTQMHNEYKGFEPTSDGKKPQIALNDKGEITDANFKVGDIPDGEKTKNGMREYVFGNEKIELPKGAEFSLKDNVADIHMSENSKLIPPEKVAEKKEGEQGMTFNYKIEKGTLELPNGNVMIPLEKGKNDEKESVISYQGGQAFVDFADSTNINDVKMQGDSSVAAGFSTRENAKILYGDIADDKMRTALYFDGKKHEGTYVSFSREAAGNAYGGTLVASGGDRPFHGLTFDTLNPYVSIQSNNYLKINPGAHSTMSISPGEQSPLLHIAGEGTVRIGKSELSFEGGKMLSREVASVGSFYPSLKMSYDSGGVIRDGGYFGGGSFQWMNKNNGQVLMSNPLDTIPQYNIKSGAGFAYSDVTIAFSNVKTPLAVGGAADLVAKSEQYRSEIAGELFGKSLPRDGTKVTINLDSEGKSSQLTWARDIPQRTGHTVYLNGKPGLELDHLLKHETAHTVLATQYPLDKRLDGWIEEGLASRYDDAGRQHIRADILNDFKAGKTNLNVGLLLTRDGNIHSSDQKTYAVATSLTDYLTTRAGGMQKFLQFAEAGRDKGWDNALRTHYNINGVADLQREWQNWLSR